MEGIRIGTCSWRFPSWQGLVYREPPNGEALAEYAERYDTVEVDRWFWSLFGPRSLRLPESADAARYRDHVPEGFRFAIKAPDAITLTHYRKKKKGDPLVANPRYLDPELFAVFWQRIAPLHDRVGPILFQFEYLNRQKMEGLDAFLDGIRAFARELPAGPIYAIETRNRAFLKTRFFHALHDIDWVPVLISGYWMPSPLDAYDTDRSWLERFPSLIIRLLGPDRARIEHQTGKKWNRIVAPRDAELEGLSKMSTQLHAAGVSPWIYVNNHYEGSAPLTIERFLALLSTHSTDTR